MLCRVILQDNYQRNPALLGNKSDLGAEEWVWGGLFDFNAAEECVNLCSLSYYSG